ncbi:MAG: hypothetical protein ABSH23_04610 [Steroidobacteraceae bacterium]|jgi:hypothetical protein
MTYQGILTGLRSGAIAAAVALVVSSNAWAAEGGHVGGGGSGGGRAYGGGGRAYAGHGGYGYGYRGGWRGGYGYYGPWGWGGWGFGYGLFLATLPFYYSTYWWNGVPYYYADSNYYLWNPASGGYESVQPPPEVASQAAMQEPASIELFAYPKNGQTSEQQAKDKFECHRWARDQSGFDPTQPGGASAAPPESAAGPAAAGPAAVAPAGKRQDYLRAQTACLEARGYSVK